MSQLFYLDVWRSIVATHPGSGRMKIGIKSRLYAGFILLVALTGFIGAFAVVQQNTLNESYHLRRRLYLGAQAIFAVDGSAARLNGFAEAYRLTPKPERIVAMEQARL